MAVRVFSVEFRSAVALRILKGESVLALSTEFKIKRSILYRWRDAYRLAGKDGFKKTRGRPRGSSGLVMKTEPGMTAALDHIQDSDSATRPARTGFSSVQRNASQRCGSSRGQE